jgi:hypothetical protein
MEIGIIMEILEKDGTMAAWLAYRSKHAKYEELLRFIVICLVMVSLIVANGRIL